MRKTTASLLKKRVKNPIRRSRPFFYPRIIRPGIRKPDGSPFRKQRRKFTDIVLAVSAWVGVMGLTSSIHTIKKNERGVEKVLGEYTRTLHPGLHFTWPFFIGEVRKISTDMRTMRFSKQLVTLQGGNEGEQRVSAQVDVVVNYKVEDPYKALTAKDNYESVVSVLARTEIRNILRAFTLADANSRLRVIQFQLEGKLNDAINDWGLAIYFVDIPKISLLEIDQLQKTQPKQPEIAKMICFTIFSAIFLTSFLTGGCFALFVILALLQG